MVILRYIKNHDIFVKFGKKDYFFCEKKMYKCYLESIILYFSGLELSPAVRWLKTRPELWNGSKRARRSKRTKRPSLDTLTVKPPISTTNKWINYSYIVKFDNKQIIYIQIYPLTSVLCPQCFILWTLWDSHNLWKRNLQRSTHLPSNLPSSPITKCFLPVLVSTRTFPSLPDNFL